MMSADDEQVVKLRQACRAPRPQTSAARSVWESNGGAGQRRHTPRVVAPNPAALQAIEIPPKPVRRHPPSPWQAVFDALPVGKAVPMTEAQAMAFAAWARAHGHKVQRQKLDGERCAVWRAPADEAASS